MTHRTLPVSIYYLPKGDKDAKPKLIPAGEPIPVDAIVSKDAEKIFADNLAKMNAKTRADLAAARKEGAEMEKLAAAEQQRLAAEAEAKTATAKTATKTSTVKTGGAGQAPVVTAKT